MSTIGGYFFRKRIILIRFFCRNVTDHLNEIGELDFFVFILHFDLCDGAIGPERVDIDLDNSSAAGQTVSCFFDRSALGIGKPEKTVIFFFCDLMLIFDSLQIVYALFLGKNILCRAVYRALADARGKAVIGHKISLRNFALRIIRICFQFIQVGVFYKKFSFYFVSHLLSPSEYT